MKTRALVIAAAVTWSASGDTPPHTAGLPSASLLAAWEKADHRFTPEVKASYLAWAKAQALDTIARAGQALPADFLSWVDGDPVVAATVYGISSNGAQRLVLLRSLEIDLGSEEVRRKHLQLALAMADAYAAAVDPATLSNTNLAISIRERGLIQVVVSGDPRVRVDTRATNRTLDINDHIINFLEDHPVVTTNKVVKEVNGQKVETVSTNTRPMHAYEVYSRPERVKEFNAFLTERGFPMDLDCGNGSIVPRHWGGGRDITKAYLLFRTAYEEKGLLPRQRDPTPTPAEKAAYLIRNDSYRFPDGVKRNWPRFPLNAPWPVLDFLVRSGESLREREYVWRRFCDTGSVVGYGAYIGQIAQYPDMIKARRLQPFEFSYDTYPMRLKDGGVCGTMSNIGRFSNIALGVPAAQAGQPAHSCFVAVGGSEAKGFSLSIGQSVAGPASTSVSGRGSYISEAAKLYPVNFGLPAHLDALMVLQLNRVLPAATPAAHRLALLRSGVDVNPYNLGLVTAIQSLLDSPAEQVAFWQDLEKKLAAVDKPGCPKTGYYSTLVTGALSARLAQMPIPQDAQDLEKVQGFLADRADALWLKYQAGTVGLSNVQARLAAELRSGVAGARTPPACDLLARRITLVGAAVKSGPERQAWAGQLLATLDGQETYLSGTGRAARVQTDPSVLALRELAGSTPEIRSAFVTDLQKAVAGARTTASCTLLHDRLNVLVKHTRSPKDRAALGKALLAVIDGREGYAPDPKKPAALALDPSVPVIYSLGGDLAPVRARVAADLQASVTGVRTPESCNFLQARLATVARYAGNPEQQKAWGEELLPIVAGHESYTPPVADPKKARELADPCAVKIYQLAGRKTPAQLKAEEARLQAEEAKRQAAVPLTVAEKARQDLSAQEAVRLAPAK